MWIGYIGTTETVSGRTWGAKANKAHRVCTEELGKLGI
jgi:hypothetical protein